MPDVVPFMQPADAVTGHCVVAIAGGHFCDIVATQQADGPWSIGFPGVATGVVGVVMRDGAIGDRVPVFCEGILPVVAASGGLTAGQLVGSNTAGEAVPFVAANAATQVRVGKCLADTAAGALAPIQML